LAVAEEVRTKRAAYLKARAAELSKQTGISDQNAREVVEQALEHGVTQNFYRIQKLASPSRSVPHSATRPAIMDRAAWILLNPITWTIGAWRS
jgi:hypothetical protein